MLVTICSMMFSRVFELVVSSWPDSMILRLCAIRLDVSFSDMFDTRVQRMETNIEKRIDDLNQSMLSVSSRVRTLENRSNELKAKITESTTGWITGWTTGFSSSFFILLSKCMIFLVFVLHCFSTWSKRLLTHWQLDSRVQNEDTEDLLCGFLHHELEINYRI
jgi:hypothetical protein